MDVPLTTAFVPSTHLHDFPVLGQDRDLRAVFVQVDAQFKKSAGSTVGR
jgi:hypothetical protein